MTNKTNMFPSIIGIGMKIWHVTGNYEIKRGYKSES